MLTHEQKVARIVKRLKECKGIKPVSLKKKVVSHEVPKVNDKRHLDEKIDISDLNKILAIDKENKICVAEPGVTFVDLVNATIKHGLVPIIVPELKTITMGGAVAGCSIESMSYKHGGFHDTCIEYEVITAKGDVLTCTPENENKLLFQMIHGTFGTLGIISKLKFKLIPAKPYVKLVHEKYDNLKDYKSAIWNHFEKKDIDFMDGIIHSPTNYVLCTGNFVDEAPYINSYDWTKVYYQSTDKRKEDYMKTPNYFFRYNKGTTSVFPKSFLGRLFLRGLADTTFLLRTAEKLHKVLSPNRIPITVDTFIPFSKINKFMNWYEKEINHFPLWCVPYKVVRKYEWLFPDVFEEELFLDIAIYGMKKRDKNYYRMLEEELMKIGGIKTLISTNYYSEEEFWKIWNKENYDKVKQITDPDNIFRDLHTKMCKTARGV